MKTSVIKASAASLTLIMLGGCASTSDGRLAQAQGTGIGAGLGALAVGGITALAGGSSEQIWRNAAIGAAAGGIAGYAYGTHIAKKKAQYASMEAWIVAEIAEARNQNAAIVAYNDSLRDRIADLERRGRIARANNDRKQIGAIRSEIKVLQRESTGTVQEFSKRTEYYEAVAADPDAKSTGQASSLASVASSMRSNEQAISNNSRRLAQLDSQLSL